MQQHVRNNPNFNNKETNFLMIRQNVRYLILSCSTSLNMSTSIQHCSTLDNRNLSTIYNWLFLVCTLFWLWLFPLLFSLFSLPAFLSSLIIFLFPSLHGHRSFIVQRERRWGDAVDADVGWPPYKPGYNKITKLLLNFNKIKSG